jgi:threonine synthase
MNFVCNECGKTYPVDGLSFKCYCVGLFRLKKEVEEEVKSSISLGEIKTPVLKKY